MHESRGGMSPTQRVSSMFVYVLKSDRTGKRYIGHTNDLERRLKEHNTGHVKSTKAGLTWTIVAYKKFSSRSEARWTERSLKNSKEKLSEFLGL
jgi:putative endonuclease